MFDCICGLAAFARQIADVPDGTQIRIKVPPLTSTAKSNNPGAGRGGVYASEAKIGDVFAHLPAERHRPGTAFADAQDIRGAVGARRGFDDDRSGRED